MDANDDGRVTREELGQMLRGLSNSIPDEQIEQMMMQADTDRDGYIDIDEFIKASTSGQ